MRVFDLHTDTPTALLHGKNATMATPSKTKEFTPYIQNAACFCPRAKSDEDGYLAVLDMLRCWQEDSDILHARICLKVKESLKCVLFEKKQAYFLSIEDARILAGEIERVDALFARGVRLITPLWRDCSVIGGAWNTDVGLTPFGEAAMARFLTLGGIVDLSHASRRSHDELLTLCRRHGRAPIATHSNAYSLTPHPRNLTDEQIREIALLGGVIGLNLYPSFLSTSPTATLEDAIAHVRHIRNVGGAEVIALGSDFDGVDSLPLGIQAAEDLPSLAELMLASGFSAAEIDAFFFENAARYFLKNFP